MYTTEIIKAYLLDPNGFGVETKADITSAINRLRYEKRLFAALVLSGHSIRSAARSMGVEGNVQHRFNRVCRSIAEVLEGEVHTNWIAFTGRAGVGKSTLCRQFEREESYYYVNFTDSLKRILCDMLCEYHEISVELIHENKEKYRPILQQLGTLIGFDTDPKFVRRSLRGWEALDRPAVVFDNVRTPQQARVLHSLGFQIVRLTHPYNLTEVAGMTEEAKCHPVEEPLSKFLVDLEVSRDITAKELIQRLYNNV